MRWQTRYVRKLLMPVKVFNLHTQQLEDALALWDTGSATSAIDISTASRFGLPTVAKTRYGTMYSRNKYDADIYSLTMRYPDGTVSVFDVTGVFLEGFDILLGMDQISKGNLSIKTTNEGTILEMQFNDELSLF